MSSSTRDPNKPVTGYPTGDPPAQSDGYPAPQPNNYTAYPSTQPNSATAYPYTAPPPPNYYNNPNPNPYPYPYPSQPYDPRRATFIRRFMIAIIAILIIFGAVTLIIWLVLRPRVPSVRVQTLTVSTFNASNSQLTADWDIGFSVSNPNKKMIVLYDHLDASVFYRGEFLTETTLAPFVQGKRNETTLQAKFSTVGTYVDASSVTRMANDRSAGGVNFNLKMLAWVRFKAGAWMTRRHLMRVFCTNVRVGFSSNSAPGMLAGGSKECEVVL